MIGLMEKQETPDGLCLDVKPIQSTPVLLMLPFPNLTFKRFRSLFHKLRFRVYREFQDQVRQTNLTKSLTLTVLLIYAGLSVDVKKITIEITSKCKVRRSSKKMLYRGIKTYFKENHERIYSRSWSIIIFAQLRFHKKSEDIECLKGVC